MTQSNINNERFDREESYTADRVPAHEIKHLKRLFENFKRLGTETSFIGFREYFLYLIETYHHKDDQIDETIQTVQEQIRKDLGEEILSEIIETLKTQVS